MIIEAGEATFSLDLHRRMTVVAGVGPLEREGLVNELVGALCSGRSGVHLELATDRGQRLALVRPTGSPHRVVDVDRAEDVTDRYTMPDGGVNLLGQHGLSTRSARKQLRVTHDDLAPRSRLEEQVLALAHVDQGRLWDVAAKVQERQEALDEAADRLGQNPDDTAVLAEIEDRHATFEVAEARHERVRHITFVVGAIATLLAVPAAVLVGLLAALPLLLVAVGLTAWSARHWQQMVRARDDEQKALAAAGAESYLGFQINRVNGLIADDHQRRELLRIAEYHRAALAEWHLLAGEVSVDWAIEHRREVRQAAARLRNTVGVSNPMALTMSPAEETEADLAHALLHRIAQARTMGPDGESLPLLLDEPFPDAPPTVKAGLLELLRDASARQQIVLLTEDEDVASWARVEAMTGELSIVEPGRPATERTNGDDDRPNRRHVAA